MNRTRRSVYNRIIEKTPEQLFINSLRKDFELSPAESAGILELVKENLYGEAPSATGRIKYVCASANARHGKPLREQELLEVELTLDNGIDDLNVQKEEGSNKLRQLKILRMTEEAYNQGCLLTQEDLARLLQVSSRTIRSDIKSLVSDGNTVHTRGNDQDIGRGRSHKSRIVDLYLSGCTYDEIIRKTRHSSFAIKRYVSTFGRILMLIDKGITSEEEISRLIGQSERLTREYLELFEKYKSGGKWPEVYLEILEHLKALYPSKKKEGRSTYGSGR